MGLHALEHDHAALSSAVAELRTQASRADFPDEEFASKLVQLVEALFEHFAREEEGLFPFIERALPDQAPAIAQLQSAHDRICGAASRIVQLGEANPELALALFRRFDAEYTAHAQREAEFLRGLSGRLSEEQLRALAELLRDH